MRPAIGAVNTAGDGAPPAAFPGEAADQPQACAVDLAARIPMHAAPALVTLSCARKTLCCSAKHDQMSAAMGSDSEDDSAAACVVDSRPQAPLQLPVDMTLPLGQLPVMPLPQLPGCSQQDLLAACMPDMQPVAGPSGRGVASAAGPAPWLMGLFTCSMFEHHGCRCHPGSVRNGTVKRNENNQVRAVCAAGGRWCSGGRSGLAGARARRAPGSAARCLLTLADASGAAQLVLTKPAHTPNYPSSVLPRLYPRGGVGHLQAVPVGARRLLPGPRLPDTQVHVSTHLCMGWLVVLGGRGREHTGS